MVFVACASRMIRLYSIGIRTIANTVVVPSGEEKRFLEMIIDICKRYAGMERLASVCLELADQSKISFGM